MHTTPLATVHPIRPDVTVAPTPAPATFIVGETYDTGRGGDYCWTFTVVRRTAKFITIADPRDGETRRVGVSIGWAGHEVALPLGSYSMAPVLTADRLAA